MVLSNHAKHKVIYEESRVKLKEHALLELTARSIAHLASAIKLTQKRDSFEQLRPCKRRLYKRGLLELPGRYDKL